MQRYQLAFDFDGTAIDTAKPSPNNINVAKAYDFAIYDIFGPEGHEIYRQQGGLKNRAPSEVISDLLYANPDLVDLAGNCLELNSTNPLKQLSEQLVIQKLNYLMGEITEAWPLPMPGFLDLWATIKELNSLGEPNSPELCIDTAIISSGHKPFITKVFDTLGLPHPDILVTDDDISPLTYPTEISRRTKPARLPMGLARRQWLQKEGILNEKGFPVTQSQAKELKETRSSLNRTMYFGDDPNKDGRLAAQIGIPFGLIKPGQQFQINPEENTFVFGDFREIATILNQNKAALQEGRPLGEIFLDRAPASFEGQYQRNYKER